MRRVSELIGWPLMVSPLAEAIRLLSTPLAILNRRALLSESPGDCGQRIHPSLPIQDVTLLADPTDYAHKSASLNLGSLGISIGMGSPFRFQVDDHPVVSLLLSCGGQALGQGFLVRQSLLGPLGRSVARPRVRGWGECARGPAIRSPVAVVGGPWPSWRPAARAP